MTYYTPHDGTGLGLAAKCRRVDVVFRDGERLIEMDPMDWYEHWTWDYGSEDGSDIVGWRKA